MLRIMNSYNRHRSVVILLLDVFFCKGNAAFSAEGPVPPEGQPRCGLDKSDHPAVSPADPSQAERPATRGSSRTTEEPVEPQYC